MDAKQSVLATIRSIPNQKIEGRKRLQKLLHLLKLSGANIECEFKLHHYGPYSFDVADAADMLAAFGAIAEKQEPIGVYGTYLSTYSLSDSSENLTSPNWSKKYRNMLEFLNQHSTIELEIASTIGFFLSHGRNLQSAIDETKYMKSTKAQPKIVKKAQNILEHIDAI